MLSQLASCYKHPVIPGAGSCAGIFPKSPLPAFYSPQVPDTWLPQYLWLRLPLLLPAVLLPQRVGNVASSFLSVQNSPHSCVFWKLSLAFLPSFEFSSLSSLRTPWWILNKSYRIYSQALDNGSRRWSFAQMWDICAKKRQCPLKMLGNLASS